MRTLDQAYGLVGAAGGGATPAMSSFETTPRGEMAAIALRAAAANGFGAAEVDADVDPAPRQAGGGLVTRLQTALEQWRANRRARAERLELAMVDSATLRDLGLEAGDPHRLYAALAGAA